MGYRAAIRRGGEIAKCRSGRLRHFAICTLQWTFCNFQLSPIPSLLNIPCRLRENRYPAHRASRPAVRVGSGCFGRALHRLERSCSDSSANLGSTAGAAMPTPSPAAIATTLSGTRPTTTWAARAPSSRPARAAAANESGPSPAAAGAITILKMTGFTTPPPPGARPPIPPAIIATTK